jgi:hypothetical protein
LNMKPFGVLVRDGRVDGLQDFASHRGFACAIWSGHAKSSGGTSGYTLAAHLDATARWSGMPPRIALPFGYSPTMVWILGPLCLLPTRGAFVGWVLAGFVCTVAAIMRSKTHWWTLVVLLNPVTVYSIILGQTAILSTAAFVFLIANSGTAPGSAVWSDAIVLWMLTAKPPLALTAAVALAVRRRWRTIAIAAGLAIASTLVVSPWLGAGWAHDYLVLLGRYDRVHMPAAFAWSIVPESMSNLRAALSADAGVADDVAVRFSNVIWIGSLLTLLLAAWRWSLDDGLVWSLAILSYLLFCAHVSATEDLALLCVLIALERRLPVRLALLSLVLIFGGLHLSPAMGVLARRRPSVLFFAKIALVGVVLVAERSSVNRRARREARNHDPVANARRAGAPAR